MAFLIFVFFISCKKEKSCESCDPVQATIIDAGVVAADGCDWVVKTADNVYYHPDALPDSFKINNLAITISYQLTGDTFHCGLAGTGIPVIHVINIKK